MSKSREERLAALREIARLQQELRQSESDFESSSQEVISTLVRATSEGTPGYLHIEPKIQKEGQAMEALRRVRQKTDTRLRLSRAQAMTLFCLECMGYDGHRSGSTHSVTRREAAHEVTRCTDPECPLYEWRNKRVPLPSERR